jgi:hypothetical protein
MLKAQGTVADGTRHARANREAVVECRKRRERGTPRWGDTCEGVWHVPLQGL